MTRSSLAVFTSSSSILFEGYSVQDQAQRPEETQELILVCQSTRHPIHEFDRMSKYLYVIFVVIGVLVISALRTLVALGNALLGEKR